MLTRAEILHLADLVSKLISERVSVPKDNYLPHNVIEKRVAKWDPICIHPIRLILKGF